MTHEQLVRACKILLFKQNYYAKKAALENGELAGMINDRVDKIEKLTKSNLSEANTFLHTIHDDFEKFLTKHKNEH